MAEASASETSLSAGSEFVPETSLSAGSEFVLDTSLSAGSDFVPDTSLSAGSDFVPDTSLSAGSDFVPDTSLSAGSDFVPDTSLSAGSDFVPDTSLSAVSDFVPDTSLSAGSEYVFDFVCQPCRSNGKHAEVEKYCQDCREHLCTRCVEFHKNLSYLKDHKLVRSADAYMNIKATFVADIKVRLGFMSVFSSPNSNHIAGITGLAFVSVERLVAADCGNNRLLLIDTIKKKAISEYKTESCPFDVTVCRGEVAATLPYKRNIIFLKCDDGLVYVRDLRVDGDCFGIDCVDDKLYVVYRQEKKLEVMTVKGAVLQRFHTDDQGEELFKRPKYVTVSTANQSIYVTDWEKREFIDLGLDGKVKGRYKDRGLFCQLAVDTSGVMYLSVNNTIHLLSPLCEKVKILLTKQDGLYRPHSICHCASTERLYIGMRDGSIKIYQISRD